MFALAGCAQPIPAPPPPPAETVAPAPDPASLPCERITGIVVEKSTRTLTAQCTGGAARRWTIALSRDRDGPKQRRGDQRMPEGVYHVMGPARASRFHRFLAIDYPSIVDADRALADGLVDRATRDAIADAHARSRRPPQHTALGGHLGLHGEGARWRGDSLGLDWTAGCVGMSDADMDFLVEHTRDGTPLEIIP